MDPGFTLSGPELSWRKFRAVGGSFESISDPRAGGSTPGHEMGIGGRGCRNDLRE